jgi:hypothetical protein
VPPRTSTSGGFADRLGIGTDEILATALYLGFMIFIRLQSV